MNSSRELYQRIYEESDWYGNSALDRCPGTRLFPLYEKWLGKRVIDLGCGRGDTVELLNRSGFDASGVDQVHCAENMLRGDITLPLEFASEFDTALCIDVIEHLTDDQVKGLSHNLLATENQVFSIHNGSSIYKGTELHINRKPFTEWNNILELDFEILDEELVHREQKLYHTRPKSNS